MKIVIQGIGIWSPCAVNWDSLVELANGGAMTAPESPGKLV